MSLSSLAALKIALGMSVTNYSRDDALSQALDASDNAIKAYCHRALESDTYTWYLGGSGAPELVLPQRPVASITSVYCDQNGYFGQAPNAFGSDTLLTNGVDYVLKYDDPEGGKSQSAILLRLQGGANPSSWYGWPNEQPRSTLTARLSPYWPKGYGNIKIVAVAGYDPIPADLAQAAMMLAVWLWKNTPRGGIPLGSQRYEEYAYSAAFGALNTPSGDPEIGTIRGLLAPYKEFAL